MKASQIKFCKTAVELHEAARHYARTYLDMGLIEMLSFRRELSNNADRLCVTLHSIEDTIEEEKRKAFKERSTQHG